MGGRGRLVKLPFSTFIGENLPACRETIDRRIGPTHLPYNWRCSSRPSGDSVWSIVPVFRQIVPLRFIIRDVSYPDDKKKGIVLRYFNSVISRNLVAVEESNGKISIQVTIFSKNNERYRMLSDDVARISRVKLHFSAIYHMRHLRGTNQTWRFRFYRQSRT